MKPEARLRKLEQAAGRQGLGGCPACRHRRDTIVSYTEGEEPEPDLPPCPRCGEVPETVIVEIIVETREEAADAVARMPDVNEIQP